MKKEFLKLGLLSFVLILTLQGCRNPTPAQPQIGATSVVGRESDETLEVLLPSTVVSRSLEGIHSNIAPHYFEDVTVYLQYASEQYFTYAWTPAEIATRRKLITNAGIPSLMFVAVDGEALANGQFALNAEFNAAYDSITVESQNIPLTIQETDANGNITGAYGTSQTAMISGTTTETILHPTLDNTRQASVELASAVARFELGTLKAADPTELTSVTIDSVYVNNYHTTLSLENTVNIAGATWENDKPAASHWSRDTGNDDLVTSDVGTMCYAFQIFPDLVPHFIYEISGTLADGIRLSDGTTGSFSGKYISITGFTELAGSAPNPHTIYKVGLTAGGIPIEVDNITGLPGVGVNALEVVITIAPWTEVTVTPEIF